MTQSLVGGVDLMENVLTLTRLTTDKIGQDVEFNSTVYIIIHT